jgi:N-acetylglucosaminyldiphosphoundecaprenol N-acetyl-beta-D-mannosaminyltransferase
VTIAVAHRAGAPPDPQVELLGMRVHALAPARVSDRMDEFVRSGQHHQVVTVNTDFLAIGRRDGGFREIVKQASLVVPDGAPVLWALRRRGHPIPSRTTGHDIIEMAVRHAREHGTSVYFLGGAPGSGDRAVDVLTKRFGAFDVAGVSAPVVGMDDAADARVARDVAATRPNFVLAGFGCPKQDRWIFDNREILSSSVCVGVGGSYSYIAGDLRRAPGWAQRAGLEWAFRLKAEPRRLLRRYVMDDMPTLVRLCREAVGS